MEDAIKEIVFAAVDQAADVLLVTDVSGRILYANRSFERVTGYRLEEIRGNNPRILRSHVHDDEFYTSMWFTILKGEVWSTPIVNRRNDGSLYQAHETITPIRDPDGNVCYYLASQEIGRAHV